MSGQPPVARPTVTAGWRLLAAGCNGIWQALAAALFPAQCLGCRRLYPHKTPPRRSGSYELEAEALPSAWFCPQCRGQWTAVESPLCTRCGLVFTSRTGPDHHCGRCLEQPGAFVRARAWGIYDQQLQMAIRALKFDARVELAPQLSRLLHAAYRRHWSPGEIDLVAPVPLHRSRFRRRGFNQAQLLLTAWDGPEQKQVVRDLLVRRRPTAPQTGLDRGQRRKNIRGALGLKRPGRSAGKRILLVDDVLTTGATAEACAAALLADGARRVDVLTLARA